jgi:hypothetical protein
MVQIVEPRFDSNYKENVALEKKRKERKKERERERERAIYYTLLFISCYDVFDYCREMIANGNTGETFLYQFRFGFYKNCLKEMFPHR